MTWVGTKVGIMLFECLASSPSIHLASLPAIDRQALPFQLPILDSTPEFEPEVQPISDSHT